MQQLTDRLIVLMGNQIKNKTAALRSTAMTQPLWPESLTKRQLHWLHESALNPAELCIYPTHWSFISTRMEKNSWDWFDLTRLKKSWAWFDLISICVDLTGFEKSWDSFDLITICVGIPEIDNNDRCGASYNLDDLANDSQDWGRVWYICCRVCVDKKAKMIHKYSQTTPKMNINHLEMQFKSNHRQRLVVWLHPELLQILTTSCKTGVYLFGCWYVNLEHHSCCAAGFYYQPAWQHSYKVISSRKHSKILTNTWDLLQPTDWKFSSLSPSTKR